MTNDSWNLENLHLKIFFFTHKTSSMTNDSWNLENLHLKIFFFTHKTSSMTNDSWNSENLHLKIQNILPIFYHSASSTKFREKMFPDKYTRNITYLQAGWGSNGTVKHLYLKIFLFTHKTSSMTNDSWNLENLHLKIQNILPIFYHSASSTKFREKMFPDKYTRNVTYLQAGWYFHEKCM